MSADPVRTVSKPPIPEPPGIEPAKAAVVPRTPSRRLGAVIALVFGGTTVALGAAMLDPDRALLPLILAAACAGLGGVVALFIRLREAGRENARLLARIETLQDRSWELHETGPGAAEAPSDAVLPIAAVSHELRAPLHAMLGLTDLLGETSLTAEQRSYVEALQGSGSALTRLVDDLLDASRIAAGRFSLDPGPTDIEALIEQIAELMAPRAHRKGIGIASRVAPGLPRVAVDVGRLRQILINLVGNAIGLTGTGAVALTVDRADGDRPGEIRLRFRVSDSGPGVAPSDRLRIFDSFERASTIKGGIGLGLAISQRIVGRMGGRIFVEPRHGGGAVFSFVLSLPVLGDASDTPSLLKRRRVLVAMRAAMEADTLRDGLAAEGAEASAASTLPDAAGLLGAAVAAGEDFDAVLLDARLLPGGDMAQARLREAAGGHVPIVILIEPGQRGSIERMHEDGFDAYLVRPVRRRSLVRIVAEATTRGGSFLRDPADERSERPAGANRPVRTLVVEDDPVHSLLLRAVLEKLGHEVVPAATAHAAREAIAGSSFDLALVDLHLDETDGLVLIHDLAARGVDRPAILAMSGADDAATALAAVGAGADLFLAKPITPQGLRQAIGEVLSGRGRDESLRHQTV